jgi:dCTP deaminase
MILSDHTIKDIIVDKKIYLINPFNPECLQPCSYDMHLGGELKKLNGVTVDLTQDTYKLKPFEFLLGSTEERVHIPFDIVGHVDGKSSIGRLGVFIHVSSGFIDSGFTGNITLEIFNCSDKEFELYHGMPIAQILFETMTTRVDRPYGSTGLDSHYQGSEGTVESKWEGL